MLASLACTLQDSEKTLSKLVRPAPCSQYRLKIFWLETFTLRFGGLLYICRKLGTLFFCQDAGSIGVKLRSFKSTWKGLPRPNFQLIDDCLVYLSWLEVTLGIPVTSWIVELMLRIAAAVAPVKPGIRSETFRLVEVVQKSFLKAFCGFIGNLIPEFR
jgi:hypothetical protein